MTIGRAVHGAAFPLFQPTRVRSRSNYSIRGFGLTMSLNMHQAQPNLKFTASDRFVHELRKRVDAYFEKTGRRRRDCAQMYFKTASILAWFAAAYVLLLFFVTSWWMILPLAIVLGISIAAIGFNIQHDGGHKAYSNHQWVNRIMALTLDMMGGSSYLW